MGETDAERTRRAIEMRERRKRNLAIALVLAGLAVLFFFMTIVRLGQNVAGQ